MISLKTYGSKIINKIYNSKVAEVNKVINKKIDLKSEQVLIGSLLGDGTLQLPKKGINASFKEIHSIKQKDYLLWKKEMLKFFDPKTSEYKILDKRTNKHYHSIILWTKVHSILTEYQRSLYINNKKSIKKHILEKIGPLALAVWYCDDGSFGYINQNGKIATYLTYEENILIVKFLKEKFNINCTINKDKKHYHLYFNVKEIMKFLRLIKGYVPECMNYKLGPLIGSNINKIKEENLKRRERDRIRHRRDMQDPIKRERIRKTKRENARQRLQDPEYRRKHNEYHKLKEREYRKKRKIRGA